MKVKELQLVEAVNDVICDVCCCSTRVEGGGLQFGVLQGLWGYGSAHDGERYEIDFCEQCFFRALASLKQERRAQTMFDENDANQCPENLGLIATGDFYNDGGTKVAK